MQLAEFESLRAGIRRSDEELAAELGVSAARLQQWRSGRERIPKYEARLLRFIAASQDRGRALEESGLPECVWMAEFDAVDLPSDSDAMLAALKRAEVHHGSCSVCLARERFVNDRYGPMPPYPAPGWLSVFALFERLPAGLRPAAIGAAALAAIVSLRLVFAVPAIIRSQVSVVEPLLAILAAAAAGASGGLAFTLVRPTLRKLGRVGDYLTGIVCVGSYLAALILVSPWAFGKQMLDGPAGWYAFGATTLLFGLVVGHTWFESTAGSSESGARAS